MRKIKQLIIITSMFVLAIPAVILAESPPIPPVIVHGTVIIDGNSASAGTVSVAGVSANIQGDGTYSIKIPSGNVDSDVKYTYKVNSIDAVTQKITGPTQEVNLSITTQPEPTPPGGGVRATPAVPATPANPKTEEPATPAIPAIPAISQVMVKGVQSDYRTIQINKILSEAGYIFGGDAESAAQNRKKQRNEGEETEIHNRYVARLTKGINGLMESNIRAFTNFILYSTETTDILGAGERAGVINSYKSAYDKLPATEAEWKDLILIANGRWPGEKSETAEINAKKEFKKVYKREANMENLNDNAAVTIIAYGLRSDSRNLGSEKAGIKSFKHIYGYNPESAIDWDIVRAIAYSGATR